MNCSYLPRAGGHSAGDVLAAVEGWPPRGSAARALPGNLPGQLASFVGRARELAEVRSLVTSSRLVTLTGAGGCGKTRLALQVAAGLADGPEDGTWLVELAAVADQYAVPTAISAALRLAAQPGRPALEGLLDALAPQDVLIVLDNCEHLIGSCAKTAEVIVRRCRRVHLLATSREPLGIGGETIYRVPSLSLPRSGDGDSVMAESCDAVALFAERARGHGVALRVAGPDGPVVAAVCRRLDGMPLAIELAAARLRSMSLAELHDRLDQRFRLLTGGSRIALARQQTLRATVEWSYSLLTGAERVLLGRLSVFAGSFGLAAAEAVCASGGLDAADIAALLGSLVDKSLVVAELTTRGLRYRLLETIRLFAAAKLAETGSGEADATAVAAAHCAYFVSVAEMAAPHLTGPDQGRWLARLDADQANLRRAAAHAAADPDQTAQVLRLGAALRRYWMARGWAWEAFDLLAPVLERPEARADPRLFAAALVTAGIAAEHCDLVAQRRLAEQGVEFGRQHGHDRLLIDSLATLCIVYQFAGEPGWALPLGEEAVECARQLGDDVLLRRSLMAYVMPLYLIDPARAGQVFAEAIACTERSGDQYTNYYLHNSAGYHALCAEDLPAARAHLQQAAQAAQAIGMSRPMVRLNLGWVLRQEGDLDGAWSQFQAGLRLSRQNGDGPGLAYASLGLACLTADQGNWHRACELHGAAQALLDRTGHRWQQGEARYRQDSLGQLRARLGQEDFDRIYAHGATLSLEQALDLASRAAD